MSERSTRNLGEWRAARKDLRGIWRTLGWEQEEWGEGFSVMSWDAPEDYGFETGAGYVLQGGMVTAILDAAMAGACWTVLAVEQVFLTADLRTEFLRSTPCAHIVATGRVVRATSRVVFCSGELHAEGRLVATSRCTQVVLPGDHRSRRATSG